MAGAEKSQGQQDQQQHPRHHCQWIKKTCLSQRQNANALKNMHKSMRSLKLNKEDRDVKRIPS